MRGGVRSTALLSVVGLLVASFSFGDSQGVDARGLAAALRSEAVTADVFGAVGVVPEAAAATADSVVVTVPTTRVSVPWAPTTTIVLDPTVEELEGVLLVSSDDSLEPLVLLPLAFSDSTRGAPLPEDEDHTKEDCLRRAKTLPLEVEGSLDRNLLAQMTHEVFECVTAAAGLDEVSPTTLRRWNGARIWGFESLSEQVAAESVVVAYCESEGFRSSALRGSNGFGYAGLFQMGRVEMSRWGEAGGSRYDPVDSAIAAANYFVFQYENGAGWGGWSPWAVVNTNFNDEVNDQVRVPVLPRFTSTDPDYRGRRGTELPEWAVDPWSWEVPGWSNTGCPFTGWRWPAAVPLARS